MKTHAAGAVRTPTHAASKNPASWGQLLKEPAVQLIVVSFLAGVALIWWQAARLQRQMIEALAIEHAHAYAHTLKDLSRVYTTEIAPRAKAMGADITPDYKKKPNALPAFSSLVAKASEVAGDKQTEVRTRFYGIDLSTGQLKGSEVQEGFIQEAWASIGKNPDQAVTRSGDIQGQPMLHYAIGWKEGENRGVLAVDVPTKPLLAQSSAYRTTLFGLFTILGLVGVGFLAVVLGKTRREAKAAERQAVSLEKEFTEQEKIIRAYEREVNDRKRQEAEILNAATVLAGVTDDLRGAIGELASSATEMAASVNETTATVEEVKQTATLSSQKAQQVSAMAQKAAQISQAGKQATEDTITEMQRIRDQMQSIAESITKLSEQSQVIRDIIDTVNDLAEQSNLLAVNASIEAQKAGAHGSGFVVVAQEVRNLAQQSKDATLRVQTILNDIEKATGASVQITAQGAKAAEAGMKQSVEAGESIRSLAQSIHEAAQSSTLIATSHQQQAIGMDQLVQAMRNIQEGSMQTVTSTRQVETCVQRLQELEHHLADLSERLTGVKRAQPLAERSSLQEAA
jgi:methyl-accepting chemotaxis protein